MVPTAIIALSEEECLALIPPTGIGRVAITVGALPAIIPIRYRWSQPGIVLSPPLDARHAAAVTDAVINFETDSFSVTGAGWTVNITGRTIPTESSDEQLLPFAIASGQRYESL